MGLGSGIRDPGSGKNLFRIPDPGVKKAPDPGSGSATLILNLHKDMEENFSGHCFVDDFYQTGNLGSVCLYKWLSSSKYCNAVNTHNDIAQK